MITVLFGCQTLSEKSGALQDPQALNHEARLAVEEGEYYRARKLAENALSLDPENQESQMLMAEILEKEIARQKDAFSSIEAEYEPEEKQEKIKTWLERSREFYRLQQYEEALLAAEKVFTYEAENQQASELIDQINKDIFSQGKEEAVFLKRMYQDESAERIARYKAQAKQQVEAEQWNAARFSIEKVLLLAPRDREAQELYEKLKEREA